MNAEDLRNRKGSIARRRPSCKTKSIVVSGDAFWRGIQMSSVGRKIWGKTYYKVEDRRAGGGRGSQFEKLKTNMGSNRTKTRFEAQGLRIARIMNNLCYFENNQKQEQGCGQKTARVGPSFLNGCDGRTGGGQRNGDKARFRKQWKWLKEK